MIEFLRNYGAGVAGAASLLAALVWLRFYFASRPIKPRRRGNLDYLWGPRDGTQWVTPGTKRYIQEIIMLEAPRRWLKTGELYLSPRSPWGAQRAGMTLAVIFVVGGIIIAPIVGWAARLVGAPFWWLAENTIGTWYRFWLG